MGPGCLAGPRGPTGPRVAQVLRSLGEPGSPGFHGGCSCPVSTVSEVRHVLGKLAVSRKTALKQARTNRSSTARGSIFQLVSLSSLTDSLLLIVVFFIFKVLAWMVEYLC